MSHYDEASGIANEYLEELSKPQRVALTNKIMILLERQERNLRGHAYRGENNGVEPTIANVVGIGTPSKPYEPDGLDD